MKTTNERRLDHLLHCISNGKLQEYAESIFHDRDCSSEYGETTFLGHSSLCIECVVGAMKQVIEEIPEE